MLADRRHDILPKVFLTFLTIFIAGIWGLTYGVLGKTASNERRVEVVERVFETTQQETNRRLARIEMSIDKLVNKIDGLRR
jgi:hypothetical protein